ncbi:MAG TPA: hypothetical protein VGS09_05065 [Actinomycetota bacterium]|nr:hypothetical protein [Actinomycetota bacterium]
MLVVSWKSLPGAAETLRSLRDRKIPFVLVTNTTTLRRRSLARRLGESGLDVEPSPGHRVSGHRRPPAHPSSGSPVPPPRLGQRRRRPRRHRPGRRRR